MEAQAEVTNLEALKVGRRIKVGTASTIEPQGKPRDRCQRGHAASGGG